MREIKICPSGSWPGFTGASAHGGCRAGRSGLTLLGARYHDEVVGQFISVDPLLDASVPGHFNAYAYSLNNPKTFSDPSGMYPTGKSSGQW